MNKKWLVSMVAATAMTVSAGALAQSATTGFYIGAEVGQTNVDGADDDIGFKLLGGYRFHPNIAAEVGYGMLYDKDDVELTSLEFVAVGMFPINNQFSILGKLGLANVEADTPFGSEDKTELTWGLGVQFEVSRNLGVRALWQRYETDDAIDFLGIGVTYKF
jgi:opacity protein-like surface antigen